MNSAGLDHGDATARAARIEALIEAFPRDPGRMGKALREARDEDPRGFAEAVVHDTRHRVTDRGYRCALVLLREAYLLIPCIANPGLTSRKQALRITQAMQEVDNNFVNNMLTAALRFPELRDPACQVRILELVSELPQSINNWRAVLRLHADGDASVRAKCARILASCHFNAQRGLARFEQADSRERADLIEGLWGADPEGASTLVNAALTDPNNRVAGNACLALYRTGNSRALSCLAQMIRRPESRFRVTAAWAMGQTRDPRFAPLLREAFASGDAALRRTALRSLGQLGQMQMEHGDVEQTKGGLRPLFVSRPASAKHAEVWARVKGCDGSFVDGIRPIDFFVLGESRGILDFSVERPPAAGVAPSVRLVYPVRLREAFARGISHGKPASAWALAGYGASSGQEEPAAAPVFRQDIRAIISAFASSEGAAETASGACRAAAGLKRGLIEQHLALFLDEGLHAGLDLSALQAECDIRSIRLHCWRIERAAEQSAESIVSEFSAALRDRYVIRTRVRESMRGFMVRDPDDVSPAIFPARRDPDRDMEVTVRRSIRSPWIGEIEWEPNSEILFPHGLPGFEDERRLLPVEIPAQRPLVYLQSVENPGVCFLCLPVQTIDPAFELHLSEDERAALELAENFPPALGADVLCLAFLIPSGSTVKTDLRAPIVINLHNFRGVQCVDSGGTEARSRAFRLDESGRWEAQCS